MRGEVLQHTAAVERFAEIERQLENNVERLKERAEGLKREGIRAEETYNEHKKEAEDLEKSLIAERKKIEKFHSEKQTILPTISEARTKTANGGNDFKNSSAKNFPAKKIGSKPCANWTKNAPFTRLDAETFRRTKTNRRKISRNSR